MERKKAAYILGLKRRYIITWVEAHSYMWNISGVHVFEAAEDGYTSFCLDSSLHCYPNLSWECKIVASRVGQSSTGVNLGVGNNEGC